MPSYQTLSTFLQKNALPFDASEAHGLFCGLLCGTTASQPQWQEILLKDQDPEIDTELLQALYAWTMQKLSDFDLEFQLLLPADKKPLPSRAEALTLWCQGFLTGLKFAHVSLKSKNQDVLEALKDISEIAKMNYEEVAANNENEDESAYVELVEYVRVAVLMIYQERTDL